MKVKIFYGPPLKVQVDVNNYLKGLPLLDIYKTETVGFSAFNEKMNDFIAVLVWTRE